MFHRTHVPRKGLLKQRRPRKKPVPLQHPEWDATVNDLTVHAATPEEILQKKVRRKSKNADAAKRELKAKKQGIPVDLMLSPGQVELEMRKLAVLREVLYEHNDLNEVLRRSDKTMESVKDIFHDAAARKTGHPNITLAPGKRAAPPIHVNAEQPSKLDALSDSVMDSQALNEEDASEESEYEDDVQFESKIDCDRFLSLLKDSMNKHPGKMQQERTPEKSEAKQEQLRAALNCTEEVKRTLSRVSSIHPDETVQDEESSKAKQIRKIDQTILGLAKDTSKLQKKLNNSSASTIVASAPQPRANITNCNMTYDDLKGAMSKVQKGILELEERKGAPTMDQAPPTDGLAGFTATLIDAVTRLTGYVNEGEMKHQSLEKVVAELKQKLDHQTALTDALTLELMNSQKQIKANCHEREALKKELEKAVAATESNDLRNENTKLHKQVQQMEKNLDEIKVKLDMFTSQNEPKPEQRASEEQDPIVVEEMTQQSKDESEMSLKMDMIKLLNALKNKNDEQQRSINSEPLPSASQPKPLPLPQALMPQATHEAAETIATVESHLRHLKLQHQEAQLRMQELTRQAEEFSREASSSRYQPPPMPADSYTSSTDSMSLASLPVKIPASRAARLQTNIPSYEAPQRDAPTSSAHQSVDKRATEVTAKEDDSQSEESFHFLNASESGSNFSVDDSVSRSPHVAVQQRAVMSSIQKTQVSLEGRISELNKQHSEAQQRLQNLVARRRNETTKKVQISVPTAEMLQTPQMSRARPSAAQAPSSAAWYSLSSHTANA